MDCPSPNKGSGMTGPFSAALIVKMSLPSACDLLFIFRLKTLGMSSLVFPSSSVRVSPVPSCPSSCTGSRPTSCGVGVRPNKIGIAKAKRLAVVSRKQYSYPYFNTAEAMNAPIMLPTEAQELHIPSNTPRLLCPNQFPIQATTTGQPVDRNS